MQLPRNLFQGNSPTFDISSELESTRKSLKKRELIFKVTFSLPLPSSVLKLPNDEHDDDDDVDDDDDDDDDGSNGHDDDDDNDDDDDDVVYLDS